jgi:hypothetical protein
MYIHVNNPESYMHDVIDVKYGRRIPGVQEADDENGELIKFQFKGNIKLIQKEE